MTLESDILIILKRDSYIVFACIYCALLFIPFGQKNLNYSESLLCSSLKSPTFHYSVGISIGICIPLLISCLLDYLQPHEITTRIFFLIRLVPLLCFIFSEFFIALDSFNCSNPVEYWQLIYLQAIVLLTATYPFLHFKCPDIWTPNRISLSLGLVSLSCVFRFYDNRVLYFGSPLGVLAFLFLVFSIIYLCLQYYRWYLKYALGKEIVNDFNDDMFLCWMYMNTLLVIQVVWLISLICFINTNAFEFNITQITLMNFGMTTTVLVYSTFHSRRLRNRIVQAQVGSRYYAWYPR